MSVFLTNGDGGDVFVLLCCQISDQAAGVVARHRAHQHWDAGLHLHGEHRDTSKMFTVEETAWRAQRHHKSFTEV